jgi:hypothetical protein
LKKNFSLEICEAHGISYKTHPDAKGGVELQKVKKQRNSLAHGNISFSECGHETTLEELEKIKCEVVRFVKDILGNIMDYSSRF